MKNYVYDQFSVSKSIKDQQSNIHFYKDIEFDLICIF